MRKPTSIGLSPIVRCRATWHGSRHWQQRGRSQGFSSHALSPYCCSPRAHVLLPAGCLFRLLERDRLFRRRSLPWPADRSRSDLGDQGLPSRPSSRPSRGARLRARGVRDLRLGRGGCSESCCCAMASSCSMTNLCHSTVSMASWAAPSKSHAPSSSSRCPPSARLRSPRS